jgi:hypothetical protein
MRRGLLLAFGVACAVASSAPPAALALAADVKTECLAAADQGQSLRDDGKYGKAHDAFSTCARDVCPKVVARSCTQWLRELDDATPTVVLGAKDAAGNDVPRAHVTLDGEPLTDVLDGKPLPVDPGEHVLRFTLPGSAPAESRVVVRAAEKNRAVTVTFAATSVAPPPGPAQPAEAPDAPLMTPRNVTAGALTVLGVAGVAVGAYFLSQSGSESNTASGLRAAIPSYQCTLTPGSSTCTQLKSAVSSQSTDSAVGATLLVTGGVLVVGAVVAWIVWPKPVAAEQTGVRWIAPTVGASGGAIAVGGTF